MPIAIWKPGIVEAGVLPAKAVVLGAEADRTRKSNGEYADVHNMILRFTQARWNKA
jgi:hypothetical protein